MAIGVNSFTTPSGNVAPVLSGSNFTAPFSGAAQFSHGSGETCAAGEYRQYIKGEYKANGSVVTHYLCAATGVIISNSVFQEDGCGPGNGCTAYGYRACGEGTASRYRPTNDTGCDYSMEDAPGFYNVQAGITYSIALTFKGELINTTNPSTPLSSNQWTTIGSVTVPTPTTVSSVADVQPNDKLMAVYTARNADNGSPEIHVVLLRKRGSPPLDPASIGLRLRDARGQAVIPTSPGVTHEIAGRDHTTATIVFTLATDAHAPVKAELSSRLANAVMDVQIR